MARTERGPLLFPEASASLVATRRGGHLIPAYGPRAGTAPRPKGADHGHDGPAPPDCPLPRAAVTTRRGSLLDRGRKGVEPGRAARSCRTEDASSASPYSA